MKRIIIITATVIVCLFGFYLYLTWISIGFIRPSRAFMHYRYNRVITEPLAEIGFSDAQFKMGLFWYYGSGVDEPTNEELDKAIYWWGKASSNGHQNAVIEFSGAIELRNKRNTY